MNDKGSESLLQLLLSYMYKNFSCCCDSRSYCEWRTV